MPGRFEPISEFIAAFEEERVYGVLCLVSDEEIREKISVYRARKASAVEAASDAISKKGWVPAG
jgi:hypothetical protein